MVVYQIGEQVVALRRLSRYVTNLPSVREDTTGSLVTPFDTEKDRMGRINWDGREPYLYYEFGTEWDIKE